MTDDGLDGWLPLSRRDISAAEDALFEGVPPHLNRPLASWIEAYLNKKPDLTERIALRMRVPLDAIDPGTLVEAVRADSIQRLLDLADTAIHLDTGLRWGLDVAGPEDNRLEASLADWIPDYRWPKGSSAAAVEQLDQILEDAGSAFEVDWRQRCLRRRVDATVTSAVEQAMAADPGRHLHQAWAATYGRHPDADKAYDEAIRAVEAAAIPVILPKGKRETLGKVLAHLEQGGHKWALAIEGDDSGAIAPLVAMLRLLWKGHTARHAGSPDFRPQRLDEAQMAVHLAATLVQWFTNGAIRKRESGSN
jgi:hypothetical protein